MLNLHSIAQFRASAFFLAHDRAFAITNRVPMQLRNSAVLEFALVLRVVFRISLIVVLVWLLFLIAFAFAVRNVVIALDQSLALSITPSQVSPFLFIAVCKHDNVPLKLTILLDRFKQLKRRELHELLLLTVLRAFSSFGKTLS